MANSNQKTKTVAASAHVADVVAEVEASKGAASVITNEIMDRMAALEAENAKLKGNQEELAVAPGLVAVQRMQGVFPGVIKNADVPHADLPKQAQITDPERSRPLPGMRFKTARGNERVDF